ncbi:hypothetical protein [Catalinimonas niigatensis]|uniref:hypothetical protein n=1 Tax=Catalinimonas niigatensis TaxID=1397264 RepID=UPI002666E901|nr:hypothetical protein [Catalinimonas niigatensis]WPP50681.1 hypothetical protein PZB72_28880 [Catalinimonas niigatensis]
MKKSLNNQEIKRYIFYSEVPYTIHIGEHYEGLILQAKEEMKAVITVRNVNECTSSIPLERALNLLEKYYKLTKRVPQALQKEKEEVQALADEPVEINKKTQPSKTALANPY